MEENKCEKAGFKHAWEDSTPPFVYLTNPPQYPDRQETCKNCGLTRYFRKEVKEWIEYSDGKERGYEWDGGTITTGDTLVLASDAGSGNNLTLKHND